MAVAERLRDLLDADPTSGTTVRAASLALGRHPDALVRAFRRRYGEPPHRYLVRRRVERAAVLLLGDLTIAQVALECGFHDQAHLTRHFVRHRGVTPGRFRAARR